MTIFVFFMNLLVAGFGLVFIGEIVTLLIGCIMWAFRWKKARRSHETD